MTVSESKGLKKGTRVYWRPRPPLGRSPIRVGMGSRPRPSRAAQPGRPILRDARTHQRFCRDRLDARPQDEGGERPGRAARARRASGPNASVKLIAQRPGPASVRCCAGDAWARRASARLCPPYERLRAASFNA
jgi:hypothetical protein